MSDAEDVLARLHSWNPRVRARGARELANIAVAPEEVASALRSASAAVRAGALGSLAKLDVARAGREALKALRDPSAEVRVIAARVVGVVCTDEPSRWALVEGFGSERDWRVRAEIVRSLGRAQGGFAGARAVLERAARDPASVVQRAALEALAAQRIPGAREILSAAKVSADARTRRCAAEGLARLDESSAGARGAGAAAPPQKGSALDRVGVPLGVRADRSR